MIRFLQLVLLMGSFLATSILFAEETPLPASNMVTANSEPYSDPTHAISVTADNSEFSIRLKSNPTTGYRWYLKPSINTWLEVIGADFVAPNTGRMGAGGDETWHFKLSPQAFSARFLLPIEFVSIRPWEMNNTPTTQTFYVVTEPKE